MVELGIITICTLEIGSTTNKYIQLGFLITATLRRKKPIIILTHFPP